MMIADDMSKLVGEHERQRVVLANEVHEATRHDHEAAAQRLADDLRRVEHVYLHEESRPTAGDAHELVEDRAYAHGYRVVGAECAVLLALKHEDPPRLAERKIARLFRGDACRDERDGEEEEYSRRIAHGRFISSVWMLSARSTAPIWR